MHPHLHAVVIAGGSGTRFWPLSRRARPKQLLALDGREALRAMKADPRFKSIRVVVMTTSQADEDIAHTYNLSASSYITKPVTFERLLEVIRVLGQYWLEIVQLPDTGDDNPS